MTLLEKLKANLIIQHDQDDVLLRSFLTAAMSYAESFQHIPAGTYVTEDIPPTTEQGIIMLASHFYESRDGSTAGFWGDNVQAGKQVWDTCNMLFRMEKSWKF